MLNTEIIIISCLGDISQEREIKPLLLYLNPDTYINICIIDILNDIYILSQMLAKYILITLLLGPMFQYCIPYMIQESNSDCDCECFYKLCYDNVQQCEEFCGQPENDDWCFWMADHCFLYYYGVDDDGSLITKLTTTTTSSSNILSCLSLLLFLVLTTVSA